MLLNFTHQAAYILHARSFRDTSLLLEIYTKEFGRLGVIARGAKRGKRPLTGILQPFTPLSLSAKGRGEIITMTLVEQTKMPWRLSGQRQIAGLYVNELMVRLLGKHEGAGLLFENYQHTLEALQEGSVEIALRCFERRLLEALGYGLTFDVTLPDCTPIRAEDTYTYIPHQGFALLEKRTSSTLHFRGSALFKIAAEDYADETARLGAKQLFRAVLQSYLGNKPLMSRQLWQKEESME